ncbi:unnamed protein product [Toxocara canis]|uniref:Pseudouridine-5'-phosphate glycosidase n=1 Tax=Toxocara canis TaxID=6265 RepID=A0A183UFX7_TOXCA|nr:unnamed protein product [Toxocara canis]
MFLSGVRCALRRACSIPSNRLCISEEVRSALNEGRGVVALESTVITHGLPRPQNVKLAQSLQNIVRSHGAVPATIALFDGMVHIGLNDEQLKRIADDVDSIKVSKRDIPYALVNKLVGGTTVAATVYLADVVGIRVFATGGLGGVHRGVNETFDISADLLELASAPVAVVCAGVKSILDVQKTLEYLETNSVPVIVYGNTLNFPGFFTAETTWKAHVSTQSLEEIADLMECSRAMGLPSGTIVACPIPSEHEAEGKLVNEAIEAAVMECRLRCSEFHVAFLADIALLENNAHIASKLANILTQRNRSTNESEARTSISSSSMKKPTESEKKTPTVV